MILGQIILSSILIICGFLVKKYPTLIAGYNMLSKSEKQKVNINKLSSFLMYTLIVCGGITLISYLILMRFQINENHIFLFNVTLITAIIVGVSIYLNAKFMNNSNNN
ncbi:DUF3784 domain-containing protein [Winogradskyella sp.]|uniref:DUF3784 domain-containing protein n=1 Tax=Winogradskyella sp. TaxID=1883156 RepID=UPI00345C9401